MQHRIIAPSELIINSDGSIFHLHLRPEQLADVVILVGDRQRVDAVAAYFDDVECDVVNRECHTITGSYRGRRMSVLSTGIGIGNIDICLTELDALANIDFATRTVKEELRRLTLVRLGTSGALQADIEVGDMIFARTSLGFDSLLGYYADRDKVCNLAMEQDFIEKMQWGRKLPTPYFVDADKELFELFKDCTKEGITVAAPGFYAPQGRYVRLAPSDPTLNEKMEAWRYATRRITNYEMEGSALAALAALMGHRAATICTIIAQRVAGKAQTDYKPFVERMISTALDRLARLE